MCDRLGADTIAEMKPRVYLETTIPSYLTAWTSTLLLRAAHQQATRVWWAQRDEFDLFVSQLVLSECQRGDATAAADRMKVLLGIPSLDQPDVVRPLTEALLRDVPLPAKAAADAVHIATAAVHGLQYLLTWNCRHISNATLRPKIETICRAFGCEPPTICNPLELMVRPIHTEEDEP